MLFSYECFENVFEVYKKDSNAWNGAKLPKMYHNCFQALQNPGLGLMNYEKYIYSTKSTIVCILYDQFQCHIGSIIKENKCIDSHL